MESKFKYKTYSMSYLKCLGKLTFELAHAHPAALSKSTQVSGKILLVSQ